MRRIVILLAVAVMLPSCGRGYEESNQSIVGELPVLDGVVLIEEQHYGFCSGDTCLFGNDRSGALLVYSVDTEMYSQKALVEAYRSGLIDWEASIDRTCLNANPSLCEEVILASFTKGDARIDLNLDNWSVATFELHVDAKGAT